MRGRDPAVGNVLTVEIFGVIPVPSQGWPSSTTQVFLYLLFLGNNARVLAGRSVRRTASNFIALYQSQLAWCARRSNYSRARAQLKFHALSQCGALSHPAWAAIDWSWFLGLWTARLTAQQQSRVLESLCNTIHRKRCCSYCFCRCRRELRRARTNYFDASYVRDPQSSGTEVLGTANIDLWQRKPIIG